MLKLDCGLLWFNNRFLPKGEMERLLGCGQVWYFSVVNESEADQGQTRRSNASDGCISHLQLFKINIQGQNDLLSENPSYELAVGNADSTHPSVMLNPVYVE